MAFADLKVRINLNKLAVAADRGIITYFFSKPSNTCVNINQSRTATSNYTLPITQINYM